MLTATMVSAQEWAEETFGTVHVGDERRSRRVVQIAAAVAHDPGASLPAQLHDEAALKATYRFLETPDITFEQLIAPHVAQTRQLMRQQAQVLLHQDTTEVDDQHHPKTTGLGPIGNGTHHGYLLQTVLAVRPGTLEVLGLAHQEPFLRQPVPKGETKRERHRRERESDVWYRSVQAIGSPPPGVQWIHVGDRYGDMFPFLTLCQQLHCDFLVRAARDRCVDLLVEDPQAPVARRSHHKRPAGQEPQPATRHLFEVVGSWPVQATHDLELEASQKRRHRVAHVVLSWGRVRLFPPQGPDGVGLAPLVVWVVRVWEPEPPPDGEPLEWVLLTSVPIQSAEQAWERVEWYRARWEVEDSHQGLKTGCGIEERHLQTYEGLRRLLGLLSPLAVRLLQLRWAARQTPEQAAAGVLPASVVQVVAALAAIPPAELSVEQAWHTLARYGGYLGRKGDGPPGWKTLWKGWFYVQAVLEGVHLAARLALELSSFP
jgi:hypothetical protein